MKITNEELLSVEIDDNHFNEVVELLKDGKEATLMTSMGVANIYGLRRGSLTFTVVADDKENISWFNVEV